MHLSDIISIPNMVLNMWEIKLKKTRLLSRPVTITLEPTLACNSNCIMCNRNYNRMETKEAEGFLSWDTFNKIKPYFKYARSVLFGGFGEALLHPDYLAMLKEIKKSGTFVFFYTNGIAMKEDIGKKLVDIGMDRICISMGGASRGTYKKIRGTDSFEQVVENIKHIRDYKKKTGRKTPALFFNVVAMNSILHELEGLVELANELGVVNISMPNMVAQGDEMKSESIWLNIEKAKSAFEKAARLANKYNIEFIPPSLNDQEKSDCSALFKVLAVNWDGTVMSCALERFIIGNFKESSPEEIWNSKGMVGLRSELFKNGLEKVCPQCTCWDNNPDNFLNPSLNSREHAIRLVK
jgi:radical SAM protein with 4Fe4S-binding SPASM domain